MFIDTLIPGRVPAFEEVEGDAKKAWLGEQNAQAWKKAYQDMRAKYTVLLPVVPEDAPAIGGRPAEAVVAVLRLAARRAAARSVARAACGFSARVAAGLSRAHRDGPRTVQRAVAHAVARGHAASNRPRVLPDRVKDLKQPVVSELPRTRRSSVPAGSKRARTD